MTDRHGMRKHVAIPCDDENGRTWDVWRRGGVVHQCIPTRREAREIAKRYDDEEAAAAHLLIHEQ
jgi:hypothetical protein